MLVKLSLEEAAARVKISKKSLDDYLMQLRSAKKFGFDFSQHSDEKVGVIRSFVRKKKIEERKRLALRQAKAVAELQGLADEIKSGGEDNDACPFPFIVKRPAVKKRKSGKGAKYVQFKNK